MHIWVDADACPKVIKEILYRAVERVQVTMTMVANKKLQIPKSKLIEMVEVAAGADVADSEIVARMDAGDLVITADIPLAADVITKNADPTLLFQSDLSSSHSGRIQVSIFDLENGNPLAARLSIRSKKPIFPLNTIGCTG